VYLYVGTSRQSEANEEVADEIHALRRIFAAMSTYYYYSVASSVPDKGLLPKSFAFAWVETILMEWTTPLEVRRFGVSCHAAANSRMLHEYDVV
jgi:hypothetical protein